MRVSEWGSPLPVLRTRLVGQQNQRIDDGGAGVSDVRRDCVELSERCERQAQRESTESTTLARLFGLRRLGQRFGWCSRSEMGHESIALRAHDATARNCSVCSALATASPMPRFERAQLPPGSRLLSASQVSRQQ